jgi:hypothetical protein
MQLGAVITQDNRPIAFFYDILYEFNPIGDSLETFLADFIPNRT